MKHRLTGVVLSILTFLAFPAASISAPGNRQQKKDSLRLVIARTEGAEQLLARQELARIYLIEVRRACSIR